MRSNLSCVVATLALTGCLSDKMVDVFTEEEFDQIRKLGPLGDVPPDPTNRYADDQAVAVFGQRLFFEKSYSNVLTIADPALGTVGQSGKIACASCHDVNNYYTDTSFSPVRVPKPRALPAGEEHLLHLYERAQAEAARGERSLPDILDEIERDLILKAYEKARGVKTETARLLGVKPSALYYKLEKYGIR